MMIKKLKKRDDSVDLVSNYVCVTALSVSMHTPLWLCFNIYPFFLSISRLIVLQEDLHLEDEEKLGQEYKRLHQAMEMVGFLASTKKQYV